MNSVYLLAWILTWYRYNWRQENHPHITELLQYCRVAGRNITLRKRTMKMMRRNHKVNSMCLRIYRLILWALSGSSKYSINNLPHQIIDSHCAKPQNFNAKPSTIRDFDVDTTQNLLYNHQYGPYPSTNNPFYSQPSFPSPNYRPNEVLSHSVNTKNVYVSRQRMPTPGPYQQCNRLPEYQ